MAKEAEIVKGLGGLIIAGLVLWVLSKAKPVEAAYLEPEVLAKASPGEVGIKYLFPEYLDLTYPEPSYAFEPVHREYRFPEEKAYFAGEITYREYLQGYYNFSKKRGF